MAVERSRARVPRLLLALGVRGLQAVVLEEEGAKEGRHRARREVQRPSARPAAPCQDHI